MEAQKDKKTNYPPTTEIEWEIGKPDDMVLRRGITWKFLPMPMVYAEGRLQYIN